MCVDKDVGQDFAKSFAGAYAIASLSFRIHLVSARHNPRQQTFLRPCARRVVDVCVCVRACG